MYIIKPVKNETFSYRKEHILVRDIFFDAIDIS